MYTSIALSAPSRAHADSIVVRPWFADDVDGASRRSSRVRVPRGFRAEPGELVAPENAPALLGLGRREELKLGAFRLAGGRLVRALERLGVRAAQLDLADVVPAHVATREEAGQALAEGMALANWRFDEFEGAATNRTPRAGRLTISAPDDSFASGLRRGLATGDAVNHARLVAATPPNVCNPAWISAEARRLARTTSLRCRVIGYQEARRMGMGGLVEVGKASASKPCLVMLEHRPARVAAGARGERLALVGKTLTYDTGGYSLKVNNGMKGMKYDKCGGAVVLAAMRGIAEAKLPLHVCAFLPAAENMVGGDAFRPDDIIRMYNGVSVEVTNTDAEGRLVLADALAYACKTFRPTAIVDVATLTGGVVVALGAFSAGLFCNDDALRQRLERASERTGEKVWRLPLWPEHREFMRSQHADIMNSHPKREAHPVQGAAFLSYFVDPKVPWAHLDIAGVSAVESATDLIAPGPTGWGVRLLMELAASWAKAS